MTSEEKKQKGFQVCKTKFGDMTVITDSSLPENIIRLQGEMEYVDFNIETGDYVKYSFKLQSNPTKK